MIEQYLVDIINDYKNKGEWKFNSRNQFYFF